MALILFLGALVVVAFILTPILLDENSFGSCALTFIAGVATLIWLAGYVAPDVLGVGHVSGKVEDFARRIDTGVAYQLIALTENGGNKVVLVKKAGSSNFYALHVKEAPPEHFTLVNGKPVAIAQPAPPVSVK